MGLGGDDVALSVEFILRYGGEGGGGGGVSVDGKRVSCGNEGMKWIKKKNEEEEEGEEEGEEVVNVG